MGGDPLDERETAASADVEFESILYHITHDLRASTRAFKTIPCWIADDLKAAHIVCPDEVRESLDLLKAQGQIADQLIVDLTTFSRVGRRSDQSRWQDLRSFIDRAITEAQVPDRFEVKVSLEIDRIFAPANDLGTLLYEVIHNAWWHHGSDSGLIEIEAVMTTGYDGRNWTRLIVADDGQGISPEHREQIFEMLIRLRARDELAGSGVGLATARKIVTRLGGTVDLVTERANGAQFEIILPHPST